VPGKSGEGTKAGVENGEDKEIDDLTLTGEVGAGPLKGRFSSGGPWAVFIFGAVASAGLQAFSSGELFQWVVIFAFVAGVGLGKALWNGEMAQLRKETTRLSNEIDRVADSRDKLQGLLVDRLLSSSPDAKKKGRKQ
jgi:hypothetical protein